MSLADRLGQIFGGAAITLLGLGAGVFITASVIHDWPSRFAKQVGSSLGMFCGDVLCLMVIALGLFTMAARD